MVVLQPIKPGPPRLNFSLKRGRARRALSLLGNNNTQRNLQLAESLLTISAEEFASKWNFDPIEGVPLPSGRFQWTPFTSTTSFDPAAPTAATTTAPSSEDNDAAAKVVTCDLAASSSPSSSSRDMPNPAEDKNDEQKTCVSVTPQADTTSFTSGQVNNSTASDLLQVTAEVDKGQVDSHHNCCERTCACDLVATSERKIINPRSHSVGKDSRHLKTANTSVSRMETDSGIDSDGSVIDEPESTPSATKDDTNQETKLRQTCITEFVRPKKRATFKVPEPLTHSSSYSKKRPSSSLQDHQLNQPPHKKVLLHLRA